MATKTYDVDGLKIEMWSTQTVGAGIRLDHLYNMFPEIADTEKRTPLYITAFALFVGYLVNIKGKPETDSAKALYEWYRKHKDAFVYSDFDAAYRDYQNMDSSISTVMFEAHDATRENVATVENEVLTGEAADKAEADPSTAPEPTA